MSALKKLFKGKDDPNRYLPVPREQYIRLGLATPPENGYDDFLKLVWCRDTKDEKRQMKKAEKEGKNKDGNFQPTRTYILCLVGIYEPYRPNDPPINLNKKGYKPLPKWDDDDFRDEILRNGYFFMNDNFILQNYKQAIKPADQYPYVEQYTEAYKHWNDGQSPTREQIREHKISVAAVIMDDIDQLEHNNNNSQQAQEAPANDDDDDSAEEGDTNNNKDDELLQKMKDILQSMDVQEDDAMVEECQKRLEQRKALRKNKK